MDLSIFIPEPVPNQASAKVKLSVSINVENLPKPNKIYLKINNNLPELVRETTSEDNSERIFLFNGNHINNQNNLQIGLDAQQGSNSCNKPTITGLSVHLDYNN